jgi:hypothetical protein
MRSLTVGQASGAESARAVKRSVRLSRPLSHPLRLQLTPTLPRICQAFRGKSGACLDTISLRGQPLDKRPPTLNRTRAGARGGLVAKLPHPLCCGDSTVHNRGMTNIEDLNTEYDVLLAKWERNAVQRHNAEARLHELRTESERLMRGLIAVERELREIRGESDCNVCGSTWTGCQNRATKNPRWCCPRCAHTGGSTHRETRA